MMHYISVQEDIYQPSDNTYGFRLKTFSNSSYHNNYASEKKTVDSISILTILQEIQMRERVEVLREEVRKIIKSSNDLPAMLELIITLQRLSLDYHYEDEINEMLLIVYNSNHYDGDLNVVSHRFYLLRKSGYYVPSGEVYHI